MFGCAQPTEEGFKVVIEKVTKESESKTSRMIWFNMRQEPVLYINNHPHAPRHPDKMHDNLEVKATVNEMDTLELHYENIIKTKVEADVDKMLKISKDKSNTDNPMDRENIEENVRVDSLKSLDAIYGDIKNDIHQNFQNLRVPVVEDSKPEVEFYKEIFNQNFVFVISGKMF